MVDWITCCVLEHGSARSSGCRIHQESPGYGFTRTHSQLTVNTNRWTKQISTYKLSAENNGWVVGHNTAHAADDEAWGKDATVKPVQAHWMQCGWKEMRFLKKTSLLSVTCIMDYCGKCMPKLVLCPYNKRQVPWIRVVFLFIELIWNFETKNFFRRNHLSKW